MTISPEQFAEAEKVFAIVTKACAATPPIFRDTITMVAGNVVDLVEHLEKIAERNDLDAEAMVNSTAVEMFKRLYAAEPERIALLSICALMTAGGLFKALDRIEGIIAP